MKISLELVDAFNWRDVDPIEDKRVVTSADTDAAVHHYISTMHPEYSHMIQFGADYHKFMDNNDPVGLLEFIDKYKDDRYWRLARFANGLQTDIDAVTNTLLYPDISNGVVEGTNSLIKSIKRVGGGKAKVDLLAAKMVIRHVGKGSSATRGTT